MRRGLLASAALLVAALSIAAGSASANGVRYGVNDDEGMFNKGLGPFFTNLTALGMHDNTVTIRWDESTASGFEALNSDGATLQDFLPATIAAAGLAGVTLTFDVYPRHSLAAGDPATNAPKFAAWLKTLAQAYPSVTNYVVMNECNQPLFVNPQYDGSGNLVSAAACGAFLSAGYNALKAVNPNIFVWGIGLSPHGAQVDGASHRDSDPFSFLKAVGTWDKTQNGGAKIMDGLDVHPYPIPQSVPFAQGNSMAFGPAFGVATLPLVYQAFYDGFNGTQQPTVGPGGLKVSLNEVGIQTVTTVPGYTGTETPGWDVAGSTGDEAYQASWYKQMIDATQCDASITNVNIFKLIDQPELPNWQSGLYQLGWVAKASAAVVKNEIASVTSCPTGAPKTFVPAGSSSGGGNQGNQGNQGGQSVAAQLKDLLQNSGDTLGSVNLALLQMFGIDPSVTLPVSYVSSDALLGQLAVMLGLAQVDGNGTLTFLSAGRALGSARGLASASKKAPKPKPAKSHAFKLSLKKGSPIVFPTTKGNLNAGTFKVQITVNAGGKVGKLVTKAFTVDAKGHLSFATKPGKKPGKKPTKSTGNKKGKK